MRRKNNPLFTLGLIGLGLWGEKLLLACRSLGFSIVATDMDSKRCKDIQDAYPDIHIAPTAKDIFQNKLIDACIIATPPLTHFHLAKSAMLHQKHVLVEKPITQNPQEAKQLAALAKKHNRILMVDHIFLFSPVVTKVKLLINKGSIGSVQRIMSTREKGRIHPGSSVLWDLVPHDVSIASFLLNTNPTKGRVMTSNRAAHTLMEDATYQLFYPHNVLLQGHVSWITPVKKRSMEIIGDSGAITIQWDEGIETLTIYKTVKNKGQSSYTKEKYYSNKPKEEPMKTMLKHFVASIIHDQQPITNGSHALTIISAIDALHRSSDHHGAITHL